MPSDRRHLPPPWSQQAFRHAVVECPPRGHGGQERKVRLQHWAHLGAHAGAQHRCRIEDAIGHQQRQQQHVQRRVQHPAEARLQDAGVHAPANDVGALVRQALRARKVAARARDAKPGAEREAAVQEQLRAWQQAAQQLRAGQDPRVPKRKGAINAVGPALPPWRRSALLAGAVPRAQPQRALAELLSLYAL